jgi:adenine-specific DNA-methyltransferase
VNSDIATLENARPDITSGLLMEFDSKKACRVIDSAWRSLRSCFPEGESYDSETRRWIAFSLFTARTLGRSSESLGVQGLVELFGFRSPQDRKSLVQCREYLAERLPSVLLDFDLSTESIIRGNDLAEAIRCLAPLYDNIRTLEAWTLLLLESHQRMLTLRKSGSRSNASRKKTGTYYTPVCVAEYLVDHASPVSTVWDPACGGGVILLAAARRFLNEGISPACVLERLYGTDLDQDAVLLCRRLLWLFMREHARDNGEAFSWAELLKERIVSFDALSDSRSPGFPAEFSAIVGNPPYRKERGDKASRQTVSESMLGKRYRTARMDYWYYFVHRGLEHLAPGGRLAFIVDAYWTSSSSARRLVDHIQDASVPEEFFFLGDQPVFTGVSGRHMMMTLRKKERTISQRAGVKENASVRIVRTSSDDNRRGKKSAASLEDVLTWGIDCKTQTKRLDAIFRESRLDLTEDLPSCTVLRQESVKSQCIAKLGTLGRVRQGIVENPASITPRMLEHLPRDKARDISPGQGVFVLTHEELRSLELNEKEQQVIRPYHAPCDMDRYYATPEPSHYLIYSTEALWAEEDDCPALLRHLRPFREFMEARRETRQGRRSWRHLHWPRDPELWTSSKVILPQMGRQPSAVPIRGESYVPFNCNVFVPDSSIPESLEYFAALINSRLLGDWFQQHAKHRGVGLDVSVRVLSETPVRRIRFERAEERCLHDLIVDTVCEIMRLKIDQGPDFQCDQLEEMMDASIEELYADSLP